MTERVPAEVFPVGEFIQEELDARGWMQEDLAKIIGFTTARVNQVIKGRRGLTDETATALGAAFGTGSEYWLRLDAAYRAHKATPAKDAVARRSLLYSNAPIRELVKRRWVENSENLDVLEERVSRFYETKSMNEPPVFYSFAARKPTEDALTPLQCAWLFRAKHLARAVKASTFSDLALSRSLDKLRPLLASEEEIHEVPRILADGGIRLVVLEAIPGTKIDGATFWLSDKQPVIALSFRYDRIDWFWYTLMHEAAHVQKRDGLKQNRSVDIRLVGSDAVPSGEKLDYERVADEFACEYLVPQAELNDFIGRVSPMYSKVKIEGFAKRLQVHPGIVVGQLQHRKEIEYRHSREMLVPAKDKIGDSALTEGWGAFIDLEGVA